MQTEPYRYKLLVEYDGTSYAGWQKQPILPTIQNAIEDALEKLCEVPIPIYGAGRTDAGVHATGQVAHLELPRYFKPFVLAQAINHYLGPDQPIVILKAEEAPKDFHARFSATYRAYRYLIVNRYSPLTLEKNRAWHIPGAPLDVESMQKAAQILCGHHDFSSFRAQVCQAASPIKTLEVFEISLNNDVIEFYIKARSFLHHQVRNMVGTLTLVGKEKITAEDIKSILEARDRKMAGPTAPPEGLYLVEVGY